ncbi:MAG: electron transport complex subunit RsxC [Anaerovorax sp.]
MMRKKHLPGIHVEDYKNTMDLATVRMPLPERVYISMVQHIGAPCHPNVVPGDLVKVGQIIGDSDALFSAPIHSSVSGKVLAIESTMTLIGIWDETIIIAPDKKQEYLEGLAPPVINSKDDFIKAVRDSGMVGLGGAAFPTHVKYNPKNLDEVDILIINGAECEPFITSDYRTMMEATDYVIGGIEKTMKYLDLKKCYIGIERNKPKAIEKFREMLVDSPEIEVVQLEEKYPQGAERVLIYETTGKVLPPGKLPADIGVIVSNVSSVAMIEKYIRTGKPLVSKRITVDGNAVRTPKNLRALIGTPITDIIAFCDGYKKIPRKILMGGPMMGRALYDDDKGIIKNNNAILAFDEDWAILPSETDCINCGRCVKACPVHLMPTSIFKAYKSRDVDNLKKLNVTICMECGCCSYVCPAKKQLSFINKLAKNLVKEGGQK